MADIDSRLGVSPEQGLSGTLSPTRSRKSSNFAVSSSNASVDGNDHDHERGFMDKLKLDKLKIGRRGSMDERRKSVDVGRRISKLIAPKRRKRKDAEEAAEEEARGRKEGDVSGSDLQSITSSVNQSQRRDSIADSLLTDEETELTLRPTLDNRPSHAGYLTLSSPLIAAETVDNSLDKHTSPVSQPSRALNTSLPPSLVAEASISPTTLPPPGPSSSHSTSTHEQALADTTSPKGRPEPIVTTPPATGTPSTFVTPPTPVVPPPASPSSFTSFSARKPVAPSRLAQGSSPSSPPSQSALRRLKPASGTINPLTPAIEEAKTPGGTLTHGGLTQPNTGSFFSSVFSATQNALNQVSNSIDKSLGTRSRSGTASDEKSGTSAPEGSSVTSVVDPAPQIEPTPPKQPAIATIGSGNLSFSHLGIPDIDGESTEVPVPQTTRNTRNRSTSILQDGYMPNKTEETSAAEAVSAAYTEKPGDDNTVSPTTLEAPKKSRPRSIGSVLGSTHEEITPPGSIQSGEESKIFKRSGSVRSRISNSRRQRRESSNVVAATAGAITAALSAPSGPNDPAKPGRPGGIAVASTKRNQDFHNLFRSVPEDDYLIEDYGAALQKEILLQGRLYVSEKHVCFASNILGWTTNLVISFEEVIALKKKNTAILFPNAIVVQTLQAENVFASLISREPTYDLLLSIWKLAHPNLKVTEHGHSLDNTSPSGDIDAQEESVEGSSQGSGEYFDETNDDDGSYIDADIADARSDIGELPKIPGQRSPSGAHSPGTGGNGAPKADNTSSPAVAVVDFPGPATHAPTECNDHASHYDRQLIDTTIPAPLGKVYSMMWGPQSGAVMRKFFIEDQKSGDVQYEDDKRGLDKENKSFSFTYIKSLNASIGPKTTKCVSTNVLDAFDLEKAVSVTVSTQNPDVPSGNVFTVKTKYCLMWGPNNSTRIVASNAIEWTGKSWLKSPIEKGANDGQDKYCKDFIPFLKAELLKPAGISKTNAKVKVKGKRKQSDSIEADTVSPAVSITSTPAKASWGAFEPLHDILDIVSSMISGTTILSVLLLVMTVLWVRQAYFSPHHGATGRSVMMTPQRLAAYEEMWRREESGLWNWLEDRVSLDNIGGNDQRGHLLERNNMAGKIDNEQMSEREVDEAIRTTEEKLASLKAAVAMKKAKKGKGQKK